MTSTDIDSPSSRTAKPDLDLAQIRSHARQLQADLEVIRAELESMKARYAPGEQPERLPRRCPS
jgi:hypothetical protein